MVHEIEQAQKTGIPNESSTGHQRLSSKAMKRRRRAEGVTHFPLANRSVTTNYYFRFRKCPQISPTRSRVFLPHSLTLPTPPPLPSNRRRLAGAFLPQLYFRRHCLSWLHPPLQARHGLLQFKVISGQETSGASLDTKICELRCWNCSREACCSSVRRRRRR